MLLKSVHFNIILQYTPLSSKWFLPFKFSDQNAIWISHLYHAQYIPGSFHFNSVDHPIVWSTVDYTLRNFVNSLKPNWSYSFVYHLLYQLVTVPGLRLQHSEGTGAILDRAGSAPVLFPDDYIKTFQVVRRLLICIL